MKVVLALLVAGFLLTGASPAFAVSGSSGSGSAGIAQYPGLAPPPGGTVPDQGGTLPQQEAGGDNTPGQGSPGDEGDTLGRDEAGGTEGDNTAVRTVSVGEPGDARLPFTGYSALLVLGAGVALLATGIGVRSLRARSFAA